MLVSSSVRRGLAAVIVLVTLAGGCSSTDASPRSHAKPTPAGPTVIDFAVYGPTPVVAAYKEIAARYTVAHPTEKIVVHAYATHDQAMAALRAATNRGDPPDLFLVDHDDLAGLSQDKAVRRVDDLLAQREVDFGDGYTRSGLEAFSADAALQCMPADVSPLVVYYNPKLIELDTLAQPGHNPVSQQNGWSLDEFAAAALQPRGPGVRGLYIAPDLEQVAPFIWSGGGEVVDEVNAPTTLTLGDDASAAALEKLLVLVRNPALTFSQAALRRQSALDRFKAGKLGMILGFRDLTPELRAQQELTFDVMPLPRVSRGATIATMSGLCISSKSRQTSKAADFLTAVVSDAAAETLAATGYVMPANLDVVNSDVFLQGGQRPLSANVFAREVRNTKLLPSTPGWPLVNKTASRDLFQLFYDPVIEPLADRLKAMDAASVPLFDHSATPGASPSSSPSG